MRGKPLPVARAIRGEDERYRDPEAYKVELQKTRNSKDGTPTRGYRIDEFDILAACLFNQTHEWEYLYVATHRLALRPNMADFLVIMQRVPLRPERLPMLRAIAR